MHPESGHGTVGPRREASAARLRRWRLALVALLVLVLVPAAALGSGGDGASMAAGETSGPATMTTATATTATRPVADAVDGAAATVGGAVADVPPPETEPYRAPESVASLAWRLTGVTPAPPCTARRDPWQPDRVVLDCGATGTRSTR